MSHKDGGWDDEPEYDIDPDIEDYERYDEEEEGGGNKRTLMLLSVVALLVVFAGVVFLAYRQGSQRGVNGAPPILRADGEPTEVAREPGRQEIPASGCCGVYDRITGEGQNWLQRRRAAAAAGRGAARDRQPGSDAAGSAGAGPYGAGDRNRAHRTGGRSARGTDAVRADTTDTDAARCRGFPCAGRSGPRRNRGAAVWRGLCRPAGRAARRSLGACDLRAYAIEISRSSWRPQPRYPARRPRRQGGIYYRARAGFMDKAAATTLCERLEAQGAGCIVRER